MVIPNIVLFYVKDYNLKNRLSFLRLQSVIIVDQTPLFLLNHYILKLVLPNLKPVTITSEQLHLAWLVLKGFFFALAKGLTENETYWNANAMLLCYCI